MSETFKPRLVASLHDAFEAMIVPGCEPDDCWGWVGARDRNDTPAIPVITHDGRKTLTPARKIALEKHWFETVDGRRIYESCGNPGCVNPEHLYQKGKPGLSGDLATRATSPEERGVALAMLETGHPPGVVADYLELPPITVRRIYHQMLACGRLT